MILNYIYSRVNNIHKVFVLKLHYLDEYKDILIHKMLKNITINQKCLL